jgi:hypothetical protein
MAKKKAELTDAQKATLAARQKVEDAQKVHDAKPTDATKKHLDAAKSELRSAQAVENRERFVRVGGNRVKKIRTAIRNLSGVASPRLYHYAEADVAKAEATLTEELTKTIAKLRTALTTGSAVAKAEDDFTF